MLKIGVLNILTIIFVVAKLMGTITWPWILVLLPTIVSFGIGLVVVVFIITMTILAAIYDK